MKTDEQTTCPAKGTEGGAMSAYPVKIVRVGDDFPHAARTDLLTAPRPLYGEEFDAEIMGFQVVIDPEHQERNLALDAYRVVFVTTAAAVAATRAALSAEYGDEALDGLDDDEIAGMFQAKHLQGENR